nr:hypothetical protein [uncultured Bacteroides sp.]
MKYLVLICALFLCMACEEDRSVDPTIMPQATTTGENTFGCLMDGWVYVSGRWGTPVTTYSKQEGDTYNMTISAEVDLKSYITFTILNPKQGQIVDYTDASFDTQSLEDGKVRITRMSNGIISGTFEGTRMTKGRFDLKYRE